MIRRPKESDIVEFTRIAKTYEDNPLVNEFETCAVVEIGGKVVGFGVTRTLLEAVLYGETKKGRAKAYRELLMIAENDAKEMGFSQLYAFADEPFAKILIKQGWKLAKGICLIREL